MRPGYISEATGALSFDLSNFLKADIAEGHLRTKEVLGELRLSEGFSDRPSRR